MAEFVKGKAVLAIVYSTPYDSLGANPCFEIWPPERREHENYHFDGSLRCPPFGRTARIEFRQGRSACRDGCIQERHASQGPRSFSKAGERRYYVRSLQWHEVRNQSRPA